MSAARASASVPGAHWDSERHAFTGDVLIVDYGRGTAVVTCPDHFSHTVPMHRAQVLAGAHSAECGDPLHDSWHCDRVRESVAVVS